MTTDAPQRPPHRWRPIEDLPDDRSTLEAATIEVSGLRRAWLTKKKELETSGGLAEFNRRLIRLWCIETGVIEGLYSVSEGVTKTLVEKGFDAAYISHGDTDVPAPQLIAVLKDHERAVEGLFAFVKHDRELTTSYVKELHAVLTAHQEFCDAEDQFGNAVKVPLIRGDWKRLPNNPSAGDPLREVHEYCPPEHVASEMDRLIAMHAGHVDLEPEIAAAWLHHRFTQVHPFQDGNGRVARALATLVLLQRHGFPLVVKRTDKADYIDALRAADDVDLLPLTRQFCKLQKEACLQAIEQGKSVAATALDIPAILADVRSKLRTDAVRRPEALTDMANELRNRAHRAIKRLEKEVRQALLGVPAIGIDTESAGCNDQGPYAVELRDTAESLLYRPDEKRGSQYARLRVSHGSTTEICVSFHFVAGLDALAMAANAFVVFSQAADAQRRTSEPACLEPFTFTADQDLDKMSVAFDEWLGTTLKLGLAIWRRSL